ncbi:DNA-methyltransferase [Mesobacillus zeae]|uniref:Methyltransferase n=1 Tax=Mesobacillus zeae TaxID=1917180 RepID=A0A398BIX1_9BACI|nr:site-specific DNA-methyltransferase [Mesobacillus zeae]RID88951.1 site-specific DNA-methyltransferase [Mesobacillus zeae]
MTELLNKVTQGDCLEVSKRIESGSVDLILTDLPYGTMNGAMLDGWGGNKTSWDFAIDPKDVYAIANRILRKNGKMVLFSQEPYTSRLINEATPNVPFSYRMVWEKDHFANSLIAKKAPVSYYEDILVFSKTHDIEGVHPLRSYFTHVLEYIGLTLKQINDTLGHRRAEHTFYVTSTQYGLCTERTYDELINVFNINKMDGFKTYTELREIDKRFDSVFNLWEGGKYKSNILRYKKDYDGYHPTQKPVLLLEDLIKTFSNEGDTVVDLTAGSGSTVVAAINTCRNFIGIERESDYVDIANKRIQEARKEALM